MTSTDTPTTRFAPLRPDDPATIGGFRIVGRVGTGGMGTVYSGRLSRGRGGHGGRNGRTGYAAVKVIREELTEDPDFRERFTREVRLLGRVRSRSVPSVLGAGQDAGGPWLATEFVPGLSLSDHVKRHGPLPEHLLVGLAAGIAEALHAIHAAGIVHRDLKPGNVILSPDGPKVLDFGIARALDETVLTRTGGLLGTPGWISPESLRGAPPTPSADVFAWGGLVAYAATGQAPFGTGTTDSLAYRVLREEPDLSGLPDRWRPLVAAALSKDPARRPTAAQLAASLAGHPGGDGLPAAVDALLARTWTGVRAATPVPPPKRVSAALAVSVAAALLLVAAGGGALAARVLSPHGDGGAAETGPTETTEPQAANPSDAGTPVGEEWVPPEPTPFDTNAEWLAEVITSPSGRPTFQATPDSYSTLVYVSVASVEAVPEGVRFSFTAENVIEGHDIPSMFTVTTPEEPIAHTGAVSDDEPLRVGSDFTLTFPDAPERGLITFGDPGHVPGVSGAPPVSQCYDASAGSLSADFADCS